jgi:hypothetical protein
MVSGQHNPGQHGQRPWLPAAAPNPIQLTRTSPPLWSWAYGWGSDPIQLNRALPVKGRERGPAQDSELHRQ